MRGRDRFLLLWNCGNEMNVENTGTREEKRPTELEFSNVDDKWGHALHIIEEDGSLR